jgi:hypothetical protein
MAEIPAPSMAGFPGRHPAPHRIRRDGGKYRAAVSAQFSGVFWRLRLCNHSVFLQIANQPG